MIQPGRNIYRNRASSSNNLKITVEVSFSNREPIPQRVSYHWCLQRHVPEWTDIFLSYGNRITCLGYCPIRYHKITKQFRRSEIKMPPHSMLPRIRLALGLIYMDSHCLQNKVFRMLDCFSRSTSYETSTSFV